MMALSRYWLIGTVACSITFSAAALALDFEKDIQPILKDHCYKCHSGPNAKRKIRYDNVRYLSKVIGNEEHSVIVPGHPEKSLLMELVSLAPDDTNAMPPPRRGKPLNITQKAMIRKWIEAGASLEPGAAAPAAAAAPASTGPDKNAVQEWSNTAGKKLKAIFVAVNGDQVTFRKEDGSQFNYPYANLSKESQEMAKEFAQQ